MLNRNPAMNFKTEMQAKSGRVIMANPERGYSVILGRDGVRYYGNFDAYINTKDIREIQQGQVVNFVCSGYRPEGKKPRALLIKIDHEAYAKGAA